MNKNSYRNESYTRLRLILGDQLNPYHSWYQQVDDDVLYVIAELEQELTYTRHHIQKACAFIAAMRAFSSALSEHGHHVYHVSLDDSVKYPDLLSLLDAIIGRFSISRLEYMLPDEYRLDQQLKQYCLELDIDSSAVDSEHFYTTRSELAGFFDGKKTYLMENFYRYLRKKHNVLMVSGKPEGERWNFDTENRKKLPADHKTTTHLELSRDVSDIVAMLDRHGIATIGDIDAASFPWPVNRKESRALLDYFVKNHLCHFGTYQDAMTLDDTYIYHSRLSFSMNAKMLHPAEVVNTVVDHWKKNRETISLAQVEGYVRQILGWREYMRGVYWAKMPAYAGENYFSHSNKLPDFYWTGKTRMQCMHHAITQSLHYAYAHHIQRLMVTGNFALLTGSDPDEVDQWYLGIYIDAIEWVEITNTRGMSQYADGGLLASKPYVSSGNYINKMSNYCKSCHYSVSKKSGQGSCPFNSLYWHFMESHYETLKSNPRIAMIYRGWHKRSDEDRQAILDTARTYLENIEDL